MMIINYWQHVSKHYLLSHLLFGVIAAGFGFSVNACVLPASGNGHAVNIVSIAAIAKANLHDSLPTAVKQAQHHRLSALLTQQVNARAHYGVGDTCVFSACHIRGYAYANAIRAGPSAHA